MISEDDYADEDSHSDVVDGGDDDSSRARRAFVRSSAPSPGDL
jgi:hypothetical protein